MPIENESRSKGGAPRRWLVLLVVATLNVLSCKRAPSSGSAPEMAQRAPVPAPAGLVAEIIVAHPDRTWDTVRAKLRATTSLVPSSPAVFLGGALGLPLGVLEQLDFNVPMFGLIVEEGGALGALGAIHVKDGPRLVQAMTMSSPRYVKENQPGSETVHLHPEKPDPEGPSFAVSGNYLLVGHGKALLDRCAPFITRTLPGRPLPDEDLVATLGQSALAGPISARLKTLWHAWKKDREADDVRLREKHGGSAPDFGDPAEALADMDAKASRFFAVLGDFEEARVSIAIGRGEPETAERYRTLVTLKPRAAGPAKEELATMTAAGLEPLLELPQASAIAFLTRDTKSARETSAASQVEALGKVLGGRLAASDKAKIENAFRSFARGRGDWIAGAIVAGVPRSAVVRGSVSDPGELDQSVFAMLDLLGVRALAEPIGNWIGDLKISGVAEAKSAGEGTPRIVHAVRRPPKVKRPRDKSVKSHESDAFDIGWWIGKELFAGAAGHDAKQLLASLEKPEEGATLARVAYLKSAKARLGSSVAFALLVDFARLGAAGSNADEDATVLLTYGKDAGASGHAFIELEAPSSLVMSYAGSLGPLLGSSH
jgi:hypothetical protein